MTILIIEDELLAARKLTALIQAHNPAHRVLPSLDSVEDAVAWLSTQPVPDLLFLDVHLADGNSFDIFSRVRISTPVVFTTAYDQYALRAFELNSVHYLLKPLTQEGVARCFAKLAALQASCAPAPDYGLLTDLLRQSTVEYKARFMVKSGSRIQSVPVEDVAYCYAEGGVTFLMTWRRERFIIGSTLEELATTLNPRHFFRLNRQYLVGWPAIQEIHPHFKGRLKVVLTPATPAEVVVSSETTPAFKHWIDR